MIDKIVVVKKLTALEELLKRYATPSQTKFCINAAGDSYDYYKDAHDAYHASLRKVIAVLPKTLKYQILDKENLATYIFGERDLVVVVGDDGLVINVAKYVGQQLILPINADFRRHDGVLMSTKPEKAKTLLDDVLAEKMDIELLTIAEARLDNGQRLYALNDFFIGRKTHISARYTLTFSGKSEKQCSSGIIVSTGTGSTGWLLSVATAAKAYGGALPQVPFPRQSDYLVFTVREPFPSKITGAFLVYGKIMRDMPLSAISHISEEGVIFSDGIESDFLDFNAGRTVLIAPAEKKVHLIRPKS